MACTLKANGERDARAVDDAAQKVAPDGVGAQQVLGDWETDWLRRERRSRSVAGAIWSAKTAMIASTRPR